MNYHFPFAPALTLLCLLTSPAISAEADAKAVEIEQDRWFEVEVILFKQVAGKTQNTEQFTARDLSANKRRALDLLTPYLQPDIASLKQLLPPCGQAKASFPYNIESVPFSLEGDKSDEDGVNNSHNVNKTEQSAEPAITTADEESTNASSISVKVTSSAADIEEIEHSEFPQTTRLDKPSAQSQYADMVLPNYTQYPINSQAPLCVIDANFFEQHLSPKQLESFNIDGFPVEKLATTINGMEQWQADENGDITWASNKPYLISADSLRLKSIANRIKRSRNYAPLLHLGWRQVGESRRKAKAMKLFAGEHLELDYQQALAKQNEQLKAVEIQAILDERQHAELLAKSQGTLIENNLRLNSETYSENKSENTGANSTDIVLGVTNESDKLVSAELSIEHQRYMAAKQQQLDNLFQQFALLNSDKADISTDSSQTEVTQTSDSEEVLSPTHSYSEQEIKQIVEQLSTNITDLQPSTTNEKDKSLNSITPPSQPWSLDGLFKIHLDHYLYINTELNIIEASAIAKGDNKQNTTAEKTNKNQVISFKQDRRVISGEIHYFDHPHIGMVVQIRRFDPTKPADEAVSQSKK